MPKKLFLLIMLIPLLVAGVQEPVTQAGGIHQFTVTGHQLSITANNAFLRIQFYARKVARILIPSAGGWYELRNNAREKGSTEKRIELSAALLPVYVQAGSIIPEQSLLQYNSEKPPDTLSIHFYNGNASSSFGYYEDDGVGLDNGKGKFYKRAIRFNGKAETIELDKVSGQYHSQFKTIRF